MCVKLLVEIISNFIASFILKEQRSYFWYVILYIIIFLILC